MTTLAERSHHEQIRELANELERRNAEYCANIPPNQKTTNLLLMMVGRIEREQIRMDQFERDALAAQHQLIETLSERLERFMKDSLTQLQTKITTLETDYEQKLAAKDATITDLQ